MTILTEALERYPVDGLFFNMFGNRRPITNVTGHSGTASFPPVELRDIRIELVGRFARAWASAVAQPLGTTSSEGYTSFTVPSLRAYEVVVLEPAGRMP